MSETTTAIVCHYLDELRPDLMAEGASLATLPLRQIVSSLDMVDLLCFLETRFALEISDDEVTPDNFSSVPAIVCMIERKLAGQVGGEGQE
jgi:acyl carrier protein